MRLFLALACALATSCHTPPVEPAVVAAPAIPEGAPFRDEVLRFAELDRTNPPPSCPVLFVGSSSIRMWRTLEADMAPLPVLNRGFGGSSTHQVNDYFDRVVTPYRPRAIVLYAGENDIDGGRTPAQVIAEVEEFLALKRSRLGDVPVFYISVKPSKARFTQIDRQAEVNKAVRSLAQRRDDLDFIDVASAMMENGRPRDIFVADNLHMSEAGYAIWRARVREALEREGVGRLTCPR